MPDLSLLAEQIAGSDPGEFWLLTGLAIVAAVGGFAGAFMALHKARLIENTPTSRVRSAAQGYVELEGFARLLPGPEIRSPLSGARCCWWRYRIQKQETVWRDGKRQTEWRTIEAATSEELFALADASGHCVVDPHGARVHPGLRRSWRGHTRRPQRVPERSRWLQGGDYRYEEALVQVGDPLYALGWFRTQAGHHELNESAEVADLLREWKSDRRALLARFDADGDGEVDTEEWQAARTAATATVRTELLQRALDPDVHVLCKPPDRRPYLLSTLS